MPGSGFERRRWRIQRDTAGAAVKIPRSVWYFGHRKLGLLCSFKSFCPCHQKSPQTLILRRFCFINSKVYGLAIHLNFFKKCINISSVFVCFQTFRLLHHQKSITIYGDFQTICLFIQTNFRSIPLILYMQMPRKEFFLFFVYSGSKFAPSENNSQAGLAKL